MLDTQSTQILSTALLLSALYGCKHVLDHLIDEHEASVIGMQDDLTCKRRGIGQNKFPWRTTALHKAARGGHVHICRYLIEKGAKYDVIDDVRMSTRLDYSCYHGSRLVRVFSSARRLQRRMRCGHTYAN